MITKFDSLYAGHVDLDNVGYGGTPINDRRYSNEHLATALEKAQSMAVLMDGLGYNAFWMAEHHFQREGTECIPNVLLMALHLTHVTTSGLFTLPPFEVLLHTFGIDRILFSVDYPFSPNQRGRAFLDSLPLAPADREKIAFGNADRLLRLSR